MKLRILALIIPVATSLLMGHAANAAIVGSTVVGNLTFGTAAPNYFSPTFGYVPAGYSNTTSNSVVIGDPARDFGFFDGSNLDAADFTNNQLYISDTVMSGTVPWTMTFTAAAGVFSNISLVTSNFGPALTYGLVANTIVINYAGTSTNGFELAVFNLNTAPVPEPETVALMLAGLGMVGFMARRQRP